MLIRAKALQSEPLLDMTPMIDCVFNLLIFFLVATTYQAAEREMQVALPFASSAAPISTALRDLVVNVDAAGAIHVGGREITAEALAEMVKQAAAANAQQKVTVRGDRTAAYGAVVRVLDICKSSGIQEPYLDTVLE